MNLGLDLAFINRIFVSLEYYNRDTKDLLYNRPISSTTGFQNYLGNLGQLNNRGWELELRTINFAGNNFNWTSVLNMTHNKIRLYHWMVNWTSLSREAGLFIKWGCRILPSM